MSEIPIDSIAPIAENDMTQRHKHEKLILKLLSEDDRIEYCLNEGRLDILSEAQKISEEDIQNVAKSVEKTEKELAIIAAASKDAGFEAYSVYFDAMLKQMKTVKKYIAQVGIGGIKDNMSIALTLLSQAIAMEDSATKAANGLEKSITLFAKELAPLIEDDKKDTPLEDLATDESNGLPSVDELTKGLQKAFEGAGLTKKEEQGGLFSKLMSFGKKMYKKLTGSDAEKEEIKKAEKVAAAVKKLQNDARPMPDPGDAISAILKMSLNQLEKFVGGLKKAKAKPPPKGALKTLAAKVEATPPTGGSEEGGKDKKAGSEKTAAVASKLSVKDLEGELTKVVGDNEETKKLIPGAIAAIRGIDSLKDIIADAKIALHKQSLSYLLFEAESDPAPEDKKTEDKEAKKVEFETVLKAVSGAVKNEEVAKQLTAAAFKFMKEKGISVGDLPADVTAQPDSKPDDKSGGGIVPDEKFNDVFNNSKLWIQTPKKRKSILNPTNPANKQARQNWKDEFNKSAGKKVFERKHIEDTSISEGVDRILKLAGIKDEE